MKQNNNIRGEWAGSSHLAEKLEQARLGHEEFQKMLAEGWQVKDVKAKRPRIKKDRQPRQVVVTLGGTWTVKMTLEEYKQRGDGLKIVMKIY
jgi:hypothetical protein